MRLAGRVIHSLAAVWPGVQRLHLARLAVTGQPRGGRPGSPARQPVLQFGRVGFVQVLAHQAQHQVPALRSPVRSFDPRRHDLRVARRDDGPGLQPVQARAHSALQQPGVASAPPFESAGRGTVGGALGGDHAESGSLQSGLPISPRTHSTPRHQRVVSPIVRPHSPAASAAAYVGMIDRSSSDRSAAGGHDQASPEVYPGLVARKLWLTGDALDLAYLAAVLPVGDAQVMKDGDRFCMTSVEADSVPDAQVREVARKLVARINAIGRLQNASFRPVQFADAYEHDAGVTVVGATATLRARSSMTAEAVVLDADGSVVPQPPPPGPGRLAIAATNPDVAEVLQVLGQPQPPNFAELYKIDEIIKSSGRLKAVMQSAGVSDEERRLFKQTADHQDASGADSRHARNKQQPPKSPMAIDQARAMIGKLLTAWLDSF